MPEAVRLTSTRIEDISNAWPRVEHSITAMKVSELSARSGVPLPTIKFYIREKLLPAGSARAKNQAEYTEEHLSRLALIRALRDDAGMSLSVIGRALSAADAAKKDFVVAAIDALERPVGARVGERSSAFRDAEESVLALCRKRGWNVERAERAVRDAAHALAVIQRSYPVETGDVLDPYFEVAERIAEHEIPADFRPDETPNEALRYAVLGTVLFEPFILALRRVAHIARARKISDEQTQGSAARSRRNPNRKA